jgi:class 3 adenylate cyclase/CHASE2 domain-containing sensor protein
VPNERGFLPRELKDNRSTVHGLVLAAFLFGGVIGGTVGRFDWGNGFFYDLAVAMNASRSANSETHTAIIAIDAESLFSGSLSAIPRTLMQPVLAEALNTLLEARAKAVGFDILLSYSGNRWQPDHDKPLIRALYEGRGRVVLGRSSNSLPAAPFVAALGFDRESLGAMELLPSSDGIYRLVNDRTMLVGGEGVPSLVAATLANAGRDMPSAIALGDGRAAFSLPVYGLSDLLSCADTAPGLLREAFENRIVFIGSWLDEEDRKRSMTRFVRPDPDPVLPETGPEGCALRPIAVSASDGTLPGVLLHALAAEAVMADRIIRTVDWPYLVLLASLATGLGVFVSLLLSPGYSLPLGGALAALIWGLSCALFTGMIWLPPAAPMIGILSGTLFVFPVRFLNERARRHGIHRAFRQYLAPEMVERILRDPSQLHLGGEVRELTVLFCDMRGFTAFSERMADRPEELVRILNRLLTVLTEPILKHGGTVDKYMGDAVMAFWNAPILDPEHARHAVAAALDMLAAVERLNKKIFAGEPHTKAEGEGFRIGIGIHTGAAIVGNMGSEQRFDYTAVGDTVNLASRLEAQCKTFGADLIVSEDTIRQTAGRQAAGLAVLELDEVLVRGREARIGIFAVTGGPEKAETAEFIRLRERHARFLEFCRHGATIKAQQLGLELTRENPSLGPFYKSKIGGAEAGSGEKSVPIMR